MRTKIDAPKAMPSWARCAKWRWRTGGRSPPPTRRASLAAAHYMLRRPDIVDIGSLPPTTPDDLRTRTEGSRDRRRGGEVSRHHGARRRCPRPRQDRPGAGLFPSARCRGRLSHRAGRGGIRPHELGDRRHDAQEFRQRHQPLVGWPRSGGVDHAVRRRQGRSCAGGQVRCARQAAGEHLRQGALGVRQGERLQLPRRSGARSTLPSPRRTIRRM